MRNVAAHGRFAHSDIDDIGVGFGNRNRADRAGSKIIVGNRRPIYAAVNRFINPAARRAEIINIRLRRNSGDGCNTPAAKWPYLTVLQQFEWIVLLLPRRCRALGRQSSRSESDKQGGEHTAHKDSKAFKHRIFPFFSN